MVHLKTYLLSGGKSSRMGEDKGLKRLAGKPMVCYLIDTLKKLGVTPTLIAHHPEYNTFDVSVIPDKMKDKGPLAAIYTALCDAKQDVLILSADTPFIDAKTIAYLLANEKENRINILNFNGKMQPLCGIYPFGLLRKIERELQNNKLKMMTFLIENNAHNITLNGEQNVLMNINTPDDMYRAEKWLSKHTKNNK